MTQDAVYLDHQKSVENLAGTLKEAKEYLAKAEQELHEPGLSVERRAWLTEQVRFLRATIEVLEERRLQLMNFGSLKTAIIDNTAAQQASGKAITAAVEATERAVGALEPAISTLKDVSESASNQSTFLGTAALVTSGVAVAISLTPQQASTTEQVVLILVFGGIALFAGIFASRRL